MAMLVKYVDSDSTASSAGDGTTSTPYRSLEEAYDDLAGGLTNWYTGSNFNTNGGVCFVLSGTEVISSGTDAGATRIDKYRGSVSASNDGKTVRYKDWEKHETEVGVDAPSGRGTFDLNGNVLLYNADAKYVLFDGIEITSTDTSQGQFFSWGGAANTIFRDCEFHGQYSTSQNFFDSSSGGYQTWFIECKFHNFLGRTGELTWTNFDQCWFCFANTSGSDVGEIINGRKNTGIRLSNGSLMTRCMIFVGSPPNSSPSYFYPLLLKGGASVINCSIYADGVAGSGITPQGYRGNGPILNNLIQGFSGTDGDGIQLNFENGVMVHAIGGNSVGKCDTAFSPLSSSSSILDNQSIASGQTVSGKNGNEDLGDVDLFEKSGNGYDYSNRYSFFEPADQGQVLDQAIVYVSGSKHKLDRGAVEATASSGGGTGGRNLIDGGLAR